MGKKRRKVQVHLYQWATDADDARFLVLQRPPEKDSIWQPITGNVEEDEKLEVCVAREVWEETGINIIQDLEKVWEFSFAKGDKEFVETVFCARIETGQVELSHEHVAYRWLPAAEARELFHFNSNKEGLDHAVQSVHKGREKTGEK
jgi:dihydroneopterin triphosphate diphosphatase